MCVTLSQFLTTWWLFLCSAPEGPDPISEELKLVRNMDLASKEERYIDAGIQTVLDGIYVQCALQTPHLFVCPFLELHSAAMWRDRLKKLQNSR